VIKRVLVDNDILLDVLLDRQPDVEDSAKLWGLIESEQIEGYVTPTTLNTIFDIGIKNGDIEIAWQAVSDIRAIMKICPINEQILAKASSYKLDDFEFAIQIACADFIHLDHILSRKKRNFQLFYNLDFKYIYEGFFSLASVKSFLDSYWLFEKPLQSLKQYFNEEEKRLHFVDSIIKNAHYIIANSAKEFLIAQQIISSDDKEYINSYMVTIQRDMGTILQYIMYAILSHDGSVLDKLRLDYLDSSKSSKYLNLTREAMIFMVGRMKVDLLKVTNNSTDITRVEYISLIPELTNYCDRIISVIAEL